MFKKRKLIFVLLLFSCIFLSMSFVSANNITDDDSYNQDNNDSLVVDSPTKSFTDLYNLINGDLNKSEIILEDDYVYNESDENITKDYRGMKCIFINRNVTIDGQGHVINFNTSATLFLNSHVIFKNIRFNVSSSYATGIVVNGSSRCGFDWFNTTGPIFSLKLYEPLISRYSDVDKTDGDGFVGPVDDGDVSQFAPVSDLIGNNSDIGDDSNQTSYSDVNKSDYGGDFVGPVDDGDVSQFAPVSDLIGNNSDIGDDSNQTSYSDVNKTDYDGNFGPINSSQIIPVIDVPLDIGPLNIGPSDISKVNSSDIANDSNQTSIVVKKQNQPIKKVVKTSLFVEPVRVKKSAKKLVLQVVLKQGYKVLSGKKVTFKFNGKKYTARTNKKGIAKVTINKNILKKLKLGKKVKYQVKYGKNVFKKNLIVR